MRIKNKTAVLELERHLEWLDRQCVSPDRKPSICHRVQDIVTGCLHIANESPTVDLNGWLDRRRGRRRFIKNCKQVYQSPTANRELCRLLKLAISTLKADRPFRPEVFVGPLPIRTPPQKNAARSAALDRGRETQVNDRRLRKQARDARISERLNRSTGV